MLPRGTIRERLLAGTAGELNPRYTTTATEVVCVCGHETTVFPHTVKPWAEEIPGRLETDRSLAVADEDGLFTCPACERSVYVPTASMN